LAGGLGWYRETKWVVYRAIMSTSILTLTLYLLPSRLTLPTLPTIQPSLLQTVPSPPPLPRPSTAPSHSVTASTTGGDTTSRFLPFHPRRLAPPPRLTALSNPPTLALWIASVVSGQSLTNAASRLLSIALHRPSFRGEERRGGALGMSSR